MLQPTMPSPLFSRVLAITIKITLNIYPEIMMNPVEKLSFMGYDISAPKSTAITMLGTLATPIMKHKIAQI